MKSMFFKNARVLRLTDAIFPIITSLTDDLEKQRFQPGSNLEMQSLGWVPPYEGGESLVRFVGDFALITLRVSKKLLPAAVVGEVTQRRARAIEQEQGHKPGRKQMKEIKERVIDELLPKAFSVSRDTRALFMLNRGLLIIEAASSARADEVIGLLAKCIDPFPIENLYVVQSPASAMTTWLAEDEPPANFDIDQDTELRDNNSAVKYVNHTVDAAEVCHHIQDGKQATRLAMTWADRISFVLTDGLDFKRIAPLDVLKEDAAYERENPLAEHERMDAELALFGGEFGKLVSEMIYSLGGEKEL